MREFVKLFTSEVRGQIAIMRDDTPEGPVVVLLTKDGQSAVDAASRVFREHGDNGAAADEFYESLDSAEKAFATNDEIKEIMEAEEDECECEPRMLRGVEIDLNDHPELGRLLTELTQQIDRDRREQEALTEGKFVISLPENEVKQ